MFRSVLVKLSVLALLLTALTPSRAQSESASEVFSKALSVLAGLVQAPSPAESNVFSARLVFLEAQGIATELHGKELELAVRPPDYLRLSRHWGEDELTLCRAADEIWAHVPSKKFAVRGVAGAPLFSAEPGLKDYGSLGPLKLPVPSEYLLLLPVLSDVRALPEEVVNGIRCEVLEGNPKPEARKAFNIRKLSVKVWVRPEDRLPVKLAYSDEFGMHLQIELRNPQFRPFRAEEWRLKANPGDQVQVVSRSHLARFLAVTLARYTAATNPFPAIVSEGRRLLAREGGARLETIDGNRVLFLKGTPEEMGRQQGVLLRKEIRDLTQGLLYGVGIPNSLQKGRWFFSEIQQTQSRLLPHISPRHLREMDEIALAAGIERQEVRLANIFPEFFDGTGFALFGSATELGSLYQGGILDYARGIGLEANAVITVRQPAQGNAWVSVGYAGLVGAVAAMNEKRVAILEAGSRTDGPWDGKPRAQLIREVMERANNAEEAMETMRRIPRTGAHYYIISDGKTGKAFAAAAEPDKLEIIAPGRTYPSLPQAPGDAVMVSAGQSYEELARRVRLNHGRIDGRVAWELMRRPVATDLSLQAVLFEPGSLSFWVANADARSAASEARYVKYNFADLLGKSGKE